jgi:hypothetical protein
MRPGARKIEQAATEEQIGLMAAAANQMTAAVQCATEGNQKLASYYESRGLELRLRCEAARLRDPRLAFYEGRVK